MKVALIPLLLESGAIKSIDSKTNQGVSSIMVAAEYGFLEVVQLLVAYGCSTAVAKDEESLVARAMMYEKVSVADWLERVAGWGKQRTLAIHFS